MGPVTVLACVAGAAIVDPADKPTIVNTEVADWAATEALNTRGTFLCVREYLRKRRIVISSIKRKPKELQLSFLRRKGGEGGKE